MNYHVGPGIKTNSRLFGRTNSFLALLMMLTLSVSSYGQSPEVRKAFRLIDIEQPSKGISALEQLANSDPKNAAVNLYYLGLAQLRTGAKDKALATFEKGISTDDKQGLNYAGKGHVRLLEKNPTDAKANLDKALSVSKSKDINVLKAVAEAYLTDSKYLLDALNALNKAKNINATDPELNLLLGDAQLMQNAQQGGEAVSSYERAAKADPKMAKALFKVGKVYQRARANDIAIASYEKAIATDADYAPAYKELGEVYYVQKEYAKAVSMYEKYLTITEAPGQAKFQLAFFYFMAKNYEKANTIFKEVTANPNAPAFALKYYAYALTEQNKTQEARTAFENYFKKAKPEDIQASDYAYFGKLQLELKTPEGDSLANEAFAKSIDLDSAQAEILQLHGDTYLKRKKFSQAVAAFKQLMSIRQQPLSQDLWSLGRAYYYNEQWMEADTAFTKLAERQPNMTVGWQYAARARRQIDSTGVQALANPMYETLITKALENPEKYKKELVEAYLYFGSYYINIKPDIPKAKSYFEKILQVDPAHAEAKEAIKAINEAAKAPVKNGSGR
jgi:tetratricopeptide (TPR) repeat protein